MTDLQWLALGAPIALVVSVSVIVFVEELLNHAEMKRERAAARKNVPLGYSGRMTIAYGQGEFADRSQARKSGAAR